MLTDLPLHVSVCLFVRTVALSPARVWPAFVLASVCPTNNIAPVLRAMDVDDWESLGDWRGGDVLSCPASAFLPWDRRVATWTGLDAFPTRWERVAV